MAFSIIIIVLKQSVEILIKNTDCNYINIGQYIHEISLTNTTNIVPTVDLINNIISGFG